jgi:hypothetical protein
MMMSVTMRAMRSRLVSLLGLLAVLAACQGPRPAAPAGRPLVVSERGGAVRVFEIDAGAGTARLVGSPRADDTSYADAMPVRLADNRIAFISDRAGRAAIWLASADLATVHPFAAVPAPGEADSDPAPLDAGRIVFARATAPDSSAAPATPRDLFVAALDGSGLRPLTHHPADDGAPCAMPDGRAIIFVSLRDGAPRLYRLDAGAPDPEATVTPLLPGPAAPGEADTAPACLADGTVLFARRTAPRPAQVFVYSAVADGPRLRQVTDATVLPSGAGEPVSLPDRTVLLTAGPFAGTDGRSRFAVYTISEGGYNLVRLTRDRAGYSDWTRRLAPER